MLMSGSATAYERLEFIGGLCRLQLMHMKMKKVCQDCSLCMPSDVNYNDLVTLPWVTALTLMKISNKEKDIKKNDSSFELHDQWIATVQSAYLLNMFDNYNELFPERLRAVETCDDAIRYGLEMLEHYEIQLYYDPSKSSSTNAAVDDLYTYCQVMFLFNLDCIL